MKKFIKATVCTIFSIGMLVSCKAWQNTSNTKKGAGIGAVSGAVLGGVIGNNVGKGGNSEIGAVLGGVVGGVAGGIIGRRMDKQAEEIEKNVPGAEVKRVGEGINVVFDENSGIYFDSGKASLNAKSQETLMRLEKVLEDYPDTDILVSGHTDSQGAETYNLELSKKRAKAVTDFLKVNGLDASRFTVNWFGETAPKYDNTTAEGRSKNRRVELAIVANEKMQKEAVAEANN